MSTEHDNSKKYLIAGLVLFLFALVVLFYPSIQKGLSELSSGFEDPYSYEDEYPDDLATVAPRLDSDTSSIPLPPPPAEDYYPMAISDEIFDFVEVEAQFRGGENEMQKFIKSKIKYPSMSIQMGDQGKAYVRFVVEKDGSVTNVSMARSLTNELDKEAMRVIRMMPNWIPGRQKGETVRSYVVIPIVFKLR